MRPCDSAAQGQDRVHHGKRLVGAEAEFTAGAWSPSCQHRPCEGIGTAAGLCTMGARARDECLGRRKP
jgi:hypothetical protein